MRKFGKILLPLLAAAILVGCIKEGQMGYSFTDESRKAVTVVMYADAFNNLSSSITQNVDTILEGVLPQKGSGKRLFVFNKHALSDSDPTSIPAYLEEVYRDEYGKVCRDTVHCIDKSRAAVDPNVLIEVLRKAFSLAPADEYGLILSSHGSGWLPDGYSREGDNVLASFTAPRKILAEGMQGPEEISAPMPFDGPLTKAFGADHCFSGDWAQTKEMEIADMAAAIQKVRKLDWIVFDACFMGCVEVAYQLRNATTKICFSPAEVPGAGYDYNAFATQLFSDSGSPELFGKAFFDLYKYDSTYGATSTTIDCSKMDELVQVCSRLFGKYRTAMNALKPGYPGDNGVQPYFRNRTKAFRYFYDLEDILVHAGISAAEKAELDAALEHCLTYREYTDRFIDLPIHACCGMSMFLPSSGSDSLKEWYKSLDWNKATGLVE